MRIAGSFASLSLPIVLAVSLAGAVAKAGGASVPDTSQVGPYAIGHTSLMLADPTRLCHRGDRPIPVEVFYPVDAGSLAASTPEAIYPLDPINGLWPLTFSSDWEPYGNDPAYEGPLPSSEKPFPLVLFSPGWGAPIWAHNFLAGRVASHGFVVAVLYHYGDGFFLVEPFDHVATAALNRPLDLSFVLTHLLERNATPGDLLAGAIDPERVAASGWSLGGYAATALAGGVDDIGFNMESISPGVPADAYVPIPADPRIKAIALLDGSNQCMQFHELARVTVPALGIGREWSTLVELDVPWPSWQARQHAAFRGRPSYRIDVTGADHHSFSNYCEAREVLFQTDTIGQHAYDAMDWLCAAPLPNSVTRVLTTQFLIAFLKTHLGHERGYQKMLTPGYILKNEPLLEFFVTEKRSSQAIDDAWPDESIYFAHQPGSDDAKAEKNPNAAIPVPYTGLTR